jgi:hypothetical protein
MKTFERLKEELARDGQEVLETSVNPNQEVDTPKAINKYADHQIYLLVKGSTFDTGTWPERC